MMMMKKPNTSAPKKRKRLPKKPKPELSEYEETLERLHENTKKMKKLNSGGRKLYNHGDSFEVCDNENF